MSDDDDGFEQFGSNNQTSSAVENDWMVNGVENGYGENAALNLSSDSEMSSRLSSSDEGDDGWVDLVNHHISNTTYCISSFIGNCLPRFF